MRSTAARAVCQKATKSGNSGGGSCMTGFDRHLPADKDHVC
jgi:hypothetical protein